MELSAQEFSRIVTRLSGASVSSGNEEHRRANRVERQVQITIVPVEFGIPLPPVVARVKNLSSRGLGLIRDMAMPIDAQFLVRMGGEAGLRVELLCTVVHCHQLSHEAFSIGAEFTCVAPGARKSDAAEMERVRKAILG